MIVARQDCVSFEGGRLYDLDFDLVTLELDLDLVAYQNEACGPKLSKVRARTKPMHHTCER